MNVTAYDIALRFVGIKEIPGLPDNPQILAMLKLDGEWPEHDEVPWCSAFMNYVAWLLRLPRSKSLAARSWLNVGTPIALSEAKPGFDVIVLSRGEGGHVGLYAGQLGGLVQILGGNQGDAVSVKSFGLEHVLGVRRLLNP